MTGLRDSRVHVHVHTSHIDGWNLGQPPPRRRPPPPPPSAAAQSGVKCAVHKWVTFPRQGCATPYFVSSLCTTFCTRFPLSSSLPPCRGLSSFSRASVCSPPFSLLPRTWLTPGDTLTTHSLVAFRIAAHQRSGGCSEVKCFKLVPVV